MRDFARLIERYHLPVALTIAFIVLALLTPFFYYSPPSPHRYSNLSLRCLFLNLASTVLFYLFEGGKFRSLLYISILGALTSLAFLKTFQPLILPICLSLTISSVVMASLIAYYYLSKGGKP